MKNIRLLFSPSGVFSILVLCVSVFSMQVYAQRGIQGRMKDASSYIGPPGQVLQYEPYYTSSSYDVTRGSLNYKTVDPHIVDRKVIRKANLNLKVKGCDLAQIAITNLVTKYNGIILDSQLNKYVQSQSGNIVFKVLPKDLTGIFTEIKKVGEIESESVKGEDVTEQYVDVQARLQNMKVVKERLINILNEKAHEVKDILEIERELARVGGEVDALEGRLKFLSSETDMATVTVAFHENQVAVVGGLNFKERFQNALKTAIETSVNTFNGVIIVFGFLLPVLFWSVVVWGIIRIFKKSFRKS